MITILHGDDTSLSRDFYWNLKQKSKENLTFDSTLSISDLQQALSGSDLFGNAKDIFIEDLVSKRKTKDLQEVIGVIRESNANIFIWESKELTKKQLSEFGNATAKLFKIPSTIFAFLDNLKPGNGRELVKLFHKVLDDKNAEFVLVMLQRQVRILLALAPVVIASEAKQSYKNEIAASQAPRNDVISEISRLAPWQKGKLEKQAKLFTTQQLIELHKKLFDLELGMKTGGLSSPLEDEIDFFLVSV